MHKHTHIECTHRVHPADGHLHRHQTIDAVAKNAAAATVIDLAKGHSDRF